MIVYFFSGNQYIQYNRQETGPGSLTTPKPQAITDWQWPSFSKPHDQFGAEGIDAALYSGSKCYFFKGAYYIRITLDSPNGFGTSDFTEPHPVSEWGWHDNFGANDIDAALWSGPVTYFFSGNKYIRVTRGQSDFGNGGDPGYPKTIASGWGFPAPFSNGVKGAFPSGKKCYFFSGNEYIRVSRGLELAGYIDGGYPAKNTAWGWPDEFGRNGIDAILYSGGDIAPEPVGGLTSNANYWLGSNGSNLTGASVTVNVDNDLISATDGFSLQFNAVSLYIPEESRAIIQQLVIYNPRGTNQLIARLFFYGSSATSGNYSVDLVKDKALGTLPGNNHVQAGSSFTITAQYDKPTSKLTGCLFTYTPTSGVPSSVAIAITEATWGSTGQPPTIANAAPLLTYTLNIVADYSTNVSGVANFTEGQGTISYTTDQPLTATADIPSYVNSHSQTAETANVIYAALPGSRPIDVSQLWGTTPPVPVDLEEVSRPKLMSIKHALPPPVQG